MEKCRYEYKLGEIKGCKMNGSMCEFPANVQRCPIVAQNIRICADLLEIPRVVSLRKAALNARA